MDVVAFEITTAVRELNIRIGRNTSLSLSVVAEHHGETFRRLTNSLEGLSFLFLNS